MTSRTLLLRLAGPLQSWGTASRFNRRLSDHSPSKSGVIGMLAAAKGIGRRDDLGALTGLRFGVRADEPGTMLRDYQTSRPLDDDRAAASLADRYYLSDAMFLAAVEGDASLVDDLADAVRRPYFQLFLGRRSCPPAYPVFAATSDAPLAQALETHPWLLPESRRRRRDREVTVQVARDATAAETGEAIRDQPVSFDPRHREYSWRQVKRYSLTIDNPIGRRPGGHDPFSFWEE